MSSLTDASWCIDILSSANCEPDESDESDDARSSTEHILHCQVSVYDVLRQLVEKNHHDDCQKWSTVVLQQLSSAAAAHTIRVALADFVIRAIAAAGSSVGTGVATPTTSSESGSSLLYIVELLEQKVQRQKLNSSSSSSKKRRKQRRRKTDSTAASFAPPPYIVERSDCFIRETRDGRNGDAQDDAQKIAQLELYLRVVVAADSGSSSVAEIGQNTKSTMLSATVPNEILNRIDKAMYPQSQQHENKLMTHIGIALLQESIRSQVLVQQQQPSTTAAEQQQENQQQYIAFIANGSILPRQSSISYKPMVDAIPFMAPKTISTSTTIPSRLEQIVSIRHLGPWIPYIESCVPKQALVSAAKKEPHDDGVLQLRGLCIPAGVTVIVGGGYHGKSTLLQTLGVAGVYNTVPGDGRELCVTTSNAVTVRAEDGRYIQNCNISAFITTLPPSSTTATSNANNTKRFCSNDASGSTSQSANVIEAIEMGTDCLLVDEDISAANFMTRDGRMRALVNDDSIVPLLYRVNGMYDTHHISTVVVVGGVGDWLDVPHTVLWMDKYLCKDATAKAKSVSAQFSHGHVQYAGRGVVHRLIWDDGGEDGPITPIPRQPILNIGTSKQQHALLTPDTTEISFLDGTDSITLESFDDDTDQYCYFSTDMSRCEQLIGDSASKQQLLYGCGLGILQVLRMASTTHRDVGIRALLEELDAKMNRDGFLHTLLQQPTNTTTADNSTMTAHDVLMETVGCVYRPRRYEIGQALFRLRNDDAILTMEPISVVDDGTAAAAALASKVEKQRLLEIWNNRRKPVNNRFATSS